MNPKELKVGDTVWVMEIIFSSCSARCSRNLKPTEGIVTKVESNKWNTGSYEVDIAYKTDVVSGKENPRLLYRTGYWEWNNENSSSLYKTREEAVVEYNRKVNNKIDKLQSDIDSVKKKFIK